MKRTALSAGGIEKVLRVLCAIALACSAGASVSQTPAQQEYERTRKMNEDIRRQEEESARRRAQEEAAAAARARDQQFNQDMQDAQRRQQGALNQSDAASAKIEQARQAGL